MAGKQVGKLTKMFTYARTAKSETDYAMKMKRLSNQIFGEVRRPTTPASMKLVERFSAEPREQREDWIVFYPAHEETAELMSHLRNYGLYRDEYKDFVEEMERLRTLRGKNRVRKGWTDGKKPVKVVVPRYDGDNSYKRDFY